MSNQKLRCWKCGKYAVELMAFKPVRKCFRCGLEEPDMTEKEWREYVKAGRRG